MRSPIALRVEYRSIAYDCYPVGLVAYCTGDDALNNIAFIVNLTVCTLGVQNILKMYCTYSVHRFTSSKILNNHDMLYSECTV